MLQQISPSVFCWSEIHGAARNEPYSWNSYAIRVKDEGVLALVDPLGMTDEEMREIEGIGKPTHILLTCEFHVRESQRYRERWGCQIFANEVGIEDFEISIDETFRDGDDLWEHLKMIYVPDVHYPETAILVKEEGGVLIIGDLLSGGRLDQRVPEGEVGLFPAHIADLGKARRSLGKLLESEFERMYFGHGSAVGKGGKTVLKRFLESDEIWRKLEEVKRITPPPPSAM